MLSRRLLLASACALPAASMAQTGDRPPPRWIVVLLRGAVDGLSVCAPYTERAYRDERPSIALPPPGQEGGLLDLDGRFGLHPALAPLLPLWQQGQFGLVHACGQPGSGARRSHFEAQDELEAGGAPNSSKGWMTRLLDEQGGAPGTVRALYSAPVRPKLLAGADTSAALPSTARRPQAARGAQPQLMAALDKLYAQDPKLVDAWRAGEMGREQVAAALDAESARDTEMAPRMDGRMEGGNDGVKGDAPDRGAPQAGSFPATAKQLAQAMRADARLQFAVLDLGGWDTHARQGAAQGQLANRLAPLGQGLALLARELGPLWRDTVVTVVSEFGRTVRENGNAGTDHGHGNAAWLLGGRVKGGKVMGEWPTLDSSARYQGRDLAITTDIRSVLAGVAGQHLGLRDAALGRLFPGFGGGLLRVSA